MKLFVFLAGMLVFALDAQAGFRGVAWGETCDASVMYEEEQGSRFVSVDPPYVFEYEGLFVDLMWFISYRCEFEGPLQSGRYMRFEESVETAAQTFELARAAIARRRGSNGLETNFQSTEAQQVLEEWEVEPLPGATRLISWYGSSELVTLYLMELSSITSAYKYSVIVEVKEAR